MQFMHIFIYAIYAYFYLYKLIKCDIIGFGVFYEEREIMWSYCI